MDAYQHIKKGTAYPAMLLATGINDARVPCWENTKIGARLAAQLLVVAPFLSGLP